MSHRMSAVEIPDQRSIASSSMSASTAARSSKPSVHSASSIRTKDSVSPGAHVSSSHGMGSGSDHTSSKRYRYPETESAPKAIRRNRKSPRIRWNLHPLVIVRSPGRSCAQVPRVSTPIPGPISGNSPREMAPPQRESHSRAPPPARERRNRVPPTERKCGQIPGDEVMAAALLDRLLRRCHFVNIRGNSYRM